MKYRPHYWNEEPSLIDEDDYEMDNEDVDVDDEYASNTGYMPLTDKEMRYNKDF